MANTMMTDEEWDALREEHEIAYLRADICLGSPQSYSLEEKKQICADMEAIDAALRADFEALPPIAQARMLDLLQEADPDNYSWWFNTLVGRTLSR